MSSENVGRWISTSPSRGNSHASLPELFRSRSRTRPAPLDDEEAGRHHLHLHHAGAAATATADDYGVSPPDSGGYGGADPRRMSELLNSTPMRSMRLIGNSNPRYRWERYWRTQEELRALTSSSSSWPWSWLRWGKGKGKGRGEGKGKKRSKNAAAVRAYYERTNALVRQYLYIDRLLDSSLPHDLVNEYNDHCVEVPHTISEEEQGERGGGGHDGVGRADADADAGSGGTNGRAGGGILDASPGCVNGHATAAEGMGGAGSTRRKVKRTPRGIYRAPTEATPLFASRLRDVEYADGDDDEDDEDADASAAAADGRGGPTTSSRPDIPWLPEDDEDVDSGDRIVTVAILVNFLANVVLLGGKAAVVASVPSMSVLASLVDAVLDFLSTVIVWTTTWLISRQDQYRYPVGRRRLEPLGVLVFSVIMITSFVQVALESLQRLASTDREVIQLGIPALAIMVGTVVIKGLCWLWCRLVKNSSVQALAADAMTDVIFNTGSILFPIGKVSPSSWKASSLPSLSHPPPPTLGAPADGLDCLSPLPLPLVGFYASIWWMDALGGLLLSLVVILSWSRTSLRHISNLAGRGATADERSVLLYLTMRFARTIRRIQGLQAYHAGDKLNVEVDIILDAATPLRDSHDLSESLGYVLESVPAVDRAFVHADYASYNLPTHMEQQSG
ncbi:hypothetical protein GGR56DRAFT_222573 [Xylariaceae sp. FL0804]|nr:hypothetical protein GGR56DRAFT_222573 [Xylariaceae sp. FL0804]